MKRMLFVVGGAFLLILAGYLIGAKKSGEFKTQLEQEQARHEEVAAELKNQLTQSQSTGDMWRIRAELLVAAQDVTENNYGNASRRVQRVVDHLETTTVYRPTRSCGTAGYGKEGQRRGIEYGWFSRG